MDNTALLQSVGGRASQATSLAENALLGVADLVADAAMDVGQLVQNAADSRRQPPRRKRGFGFLVLIVLLGGVGFVLVRRRRSRGATLDEGLPPYPTEDPAYDQSTIGTAAGRMGSTGPGTFDPNPTNSHDPDALHEGARGMGVER